MIMPFFAYVMTILDILRSQSNISLKSLSNLEMPWHFSLDCWLQCNICNNSRINLFKNSTSGKIEQVEVQHRSQLAH